MNSSDRESWNSKIVPIEIRHKLSSSSNLEQLVWMMNTSNNVILFFFWSVIFLNILFQHETKAPFFHLSIVLLTSNVNMNGVTFFQAQPEFENQPELASVHTNVMYLKCVKMYLYVSLINFRLRWAVNILRAW